MRTPSAQWIVRACGAFRQDIQPLLDSSCTRRRKLCGSPYVSVSTGFLHPDSSYRMTCMHQYDGVFSHSE